MSFKTLLIAVGTDQDDSEIERAATIAGRLEAHLNVLVIGVAPPPPSSPYGIVSNDIWAGEIREGQEAAQARGAAIKALIDRLGARGSIETHYVDRGSIGPLAARAARYSDLTLITRQAPEVELMQTWVMDGALFESGRPILLLPPGPVSFPDAKCIVIAWDASVEAAKAVREGIGLMRQAEAVHAVLIDPVPSFQGHGPEPGADLAAYLARHGISITVHRLPREGQATSDIINRAARDLGAELIVMGGFGHSRLRQRIFGGTTTSMIEKATLPVLMAH